MFRAASPLSHLSLSLLVFPSIFLVPFFELLIFPLLGFFLPSLDFLYHLFVTFLVNVFFYCHTSLSTFPISFHINFTIYLNIYPTIFLTLLSLPSYFIISLLFYISFHYSFFFLRCIYSILLYSSSSLLLFINFLHNSSFFILFFSPSLINTPILAFLQIASLILLFLIMVLFFILTNHQTLSLSYQFSL
jgi:hypothetical protein